jgi:hypothetical protein
MLAVLGQRLCAFSPSGAGSSSPGPGLAGNISDQEVTRRVAGVRLTVRSAALFLVSAVTASLFDRLSAGVRDAVALDPDLSAAHPHGRALRRGEPLADQVGQHVDGETDGEKPRFGGTVWNAGEEL